MQTCIVRYSWRKEGIFDRVPSRTPGSRKSIQTYIFTYSRRRAGTFDRTPSRTPGSRQSIQTYILTSSWRKEGPFNRARFLAEGTWISVTGVPKCGPVQRNSSRRRLCLTVEALTVFQFLSGKLPGKRCRNSTTVRN